MSSLASMSHAYKEILSKLLRNLPQDSASKLLQSLRGLSDRESLEFCDYLNRLRPQKQFRVITAMATSTLQGKQRFLESLRDRFIEYEKIENTFKNAGIENAERSDIEFHRGGTCDKVYKAQSEKKETCDNVLEGDSVSQQSKHENDMKIEVKKKHIRTTLSRILQRKHANFHSFNTLHKTSVENISVSSPWDRVNVDAKGDTVLRSASTSSVVSRKIHSTETSDVTQMNAMLLATKIDEHEIRKLEKQLYSVCDPSSIRIPQVETHKVSEDSERPNISIHPSACPVCHVPECTCHSASLELVPNSVLQECMKPVSYHDTVPESPLRPTHDPEQCPSTKRWTAYQDEALRHSVQIHGEKNWKAIAELVPNRNHAQCLQRWRKVLKPGLVKGHWSTEEDKKLQNLISRNCLTWGAIANEIPGRTAKQCRERWKNHLNPMVNKGPYTFEEDIALIEAQARLGNKWSQIALLLPGRTEDSVKIRYKSILQNSKRAVEAYDGASNCVGYPADVRRREKDMERERLSEHVTYTVGNVPSCVDIVPLCHRNESLYGTFPPKTELGTVSQDILTTEDIFADWNKQLESEPWMDTIIML